MMNHKKNHTGAPGSTDWSESENEQILHSYDDTNNNKFRKLRAGPGASGQNPNQFIAGGNKKNFQSDNVTPQTNTRQHSKQRISEGSNISGLP